MGFKVYGRSDFPTTKTTDREFSTKEDAINYGHSISGSYNNVRVLDSGMSSVVLAQWEDGKMTKNESAARAFKSLTPHHIIKGFQAIESLFFRLLKKSGYTWGAQFQIDSCTNHNL